MEHVAEHGSFDDLPLAQIVADFERVYPAWAAPTMHQGDFMADVTRETP